MPAIKPLTESIEAAAVVAFGCESARVFVQTERMGMGGEPVKWFVLSVRYADGEAKLIGRRRTRGELLRLAKRGPLGCC